MSPCPAEDLRRWLIAQECDLFRARFKEMLPSDQVGCRARQAACGRRCRCLCRQQQHAALPQQAQYSHGLTFLIPLLRRQKAFMDANELPFKPLGCGAGLGWTLVQAGCRRRVTL